jgi:hypothetical protein
MKSQLEATNKKLTWPTLPNIHNNFSEGLQDAMVASNKIQLQTSIAIIAIVSEVLSINV